MNAGDTDIAVIGVSFELPQCATWPELDRILRTGSDRVSRYPQSRVDAMGLVRSKKDARGCWQEGIGAFDHKYFGLSRAEAELIDPRQRRMLCLADDTIGNAGYAPAQLRGRNVAVLIAGYCGILPSLLHMLTDEDRSTGRAFAGSLPAYSAGRIAYHLDLRGPAFVVDTACSSFLVALHEARWKLARSESELALVGGYAAMLGDIPAGPAAGEGLGVNSPTGRCLSFDADADGTVIGEGGGFVLLKRLDAALRDGDVVHAVIRGSALNQDAGRSNGLTSPSPTAQAEVIGAALRDADVDPATVGYVEAHGTGTRVGDPIEMRALAETYGARPASRGSLPVSSAKANFGHLDAMAGFAGLVRVIAQFRARQVFPTANFKALNPLIDLTAVPLHVAEASEPWSGEQGPRRAGISAFGLSGTNAHVIVEEGPRPVRRDQATGRKRLVVLAAPDGAALKQLTERVLEAVSSGETDLDTLADVLAVGRTQFGHRYAWIARDLGDLAQQMGDALAAGADQALPRTPLLLALGDSVVTDDAVSRLAAAHTAFADVVRRAEAHTPRRLWSAEQRALVGLVGQHAVLAGFGVRFDVVLAHGVGVVAGQVCEGTVGLDDAMASASSADEPPDRERLAKALARVGPDVTLIDLGPGGTLSAALSTALPAAVVVTLGRSADAVLRLLHLQGRTIDWATGTGRIDRRAELPVAPLAQEPCWPPVRSRTPVKAAPAVEPTHAEEDLTVPETVLRVTRELLKEPVTLDDDFLECGGDSLSGALLVSRLNDRFGTELEVLDLYDTHGLAALADRISEVLGEAGGDASGEAPRADQPLPGEDAPLSGQQAAIWTALALDPESDAYNVPAAFLIHGDLDVERLDVALGGLVARHDMMRSTLRDVGDVPRQYLEAPAVPARPLQRLEMDLSDLTAVSGREELRSRLRELIAEPFRPYDEPSRRFYLVRARFRDGDQQVLVLNFHHLFFDGWSWGLVLAELSAAAAPPAPGRSYLDHVRDQTTMLRGERGERLRRFWTDYLDGAIPGALPVSRTSPDAAMTGADLTRAISGEQTSRLRGIGSAERASLNMLFTAAWAALLWEIGGNTDVCVAVPVANRQPGDEAVIGCYVNTILVRIRIDPSQSFGELLKQVRASSLQSIGHGDFPTDQILRIGRHPSGRPLAATMLGFQTADEPRRLGADGPLLEPLDVRQSDAQFPLELTVLDGAKGLRLVLKYASGDFHRRTVSAWLDRFAVVLGRIAEEGVGFRLDSMAPQEPTPSSLPDFDF